MCPSEPVPPPYTVAQIYPDDVLVPGHQDNGARVSLWQFILVPQTDGSTRLVRLDETFHRKPTMTALDQ